MVVAFLFRRRACVIDGCLSAGRARWLGKGIVASISGLVVEYIVAIDVTRVRFPADASMWCAVTHVSIVLGGWSAITARRALDRQIRYSLAG